MSNKELDSLIIKIKNYEKRRQPLEPHQSHRDELNKHMIAYSDSFLRSISHSKAFEDDNSLADTLLEEPIKEEASSFSDILDQLWNCVDNQGLNPASGGHLGYIPGGGVFASSIGDYLAAITNRYAGMHFASPGAVNIERRLIAWMCQIFDMPKKSGGTMCSGGSIASLIGITCARDTMGITPDKVSKSVIYLCDHTHHCVHKAIRIAGLTHAIIRNIPRDLKDRMCTQSLEQQIKSDISDGLLPFIVISSAGSTDTGAVDDLYTIGLISKANNVWHHVDAAYGGFFMLCEEQRPIFRGIEDADSIVVDPHKGLFLPYGLGVLLIKDQSLLLPTFHYKANYMQDAYRDMDVFSPADLSPELTRHYRALRMWIPIKLHGIGPFRDALHEKLLLAQYATVKLKMIRYCKLRSTPMLSVVCFRLEPHQSETDNNENEQLVDFIRKRGKVFLSSTVIDGATYIRMAILSFRTNIETVDLALDEIRCYISTHIDQV